MLQPTMDQTKPDECPGTPPHVEAFTACAVALEQVSPETRGRVLRALVEFYRADFEKRPDPARAVIGQLTGATVHPDWQSSPKYGGQ